MLGLILSLRLQTKARAAPIIQIGPFSVIEHDGFQPPMPERDFRPITRRYTAHMPQSVVREVRRRAKGSSRCRPIQRTLEWYYSLGRHSLADGDDERLGWAAWA